MGKENECALLMLSLDWWEAMLEVFAWQVHDVWPDWESEALLEVSWWSSTCLLSELVILCK